MNTSIRKGDNVVVIVGKDKGKTGKVIRVEDGRVTIEGVGMVIKHKKARSAQQKSKREKIAGTIDISNVQILCKCGKAIRVSHKVEKGTKHRVCAKCGEVLDKKFVKIKEKAREEVAAEKKDEEETTKKPLQRREVKHAAESKIKTPQATKNVSFHRNMGGQS